MKSQIRLHSKEQLDNLSLSGSLLHNTLHSLKRINSFLGNHRQLGNAVISYCTSQPDLQKIHIIDLGCGGGDCILYLFKKLKKHNIEAYFTGIDGNPDSIAYARKLNPYPSHIKYCTKDILNTDFLLPKCDLLISSHFIYHFNDEELQLFLKKLKHKQLKHIIFSELRRTTIAYYIFKIVRVFLPINKMAKTDGAIAIQRAFTIKELKTIIHNSTIGKYKVSKKPFFRMIAQIDLTK